MNPAHMTLQDLERRGDDAALREIGRRVIEKGYCREGVFCQHHYDLCELEGLLEVENAHGLPDEYEQVWDAGYLECLHQHPLTQYIAARLRKWLRIGAA
jgi:hypothetical protein